MDFKAEFDGQVQNLIDKNYPQILGISKEEFLDLVQPLESKLSEFNREIDFENGYLPFVLVVKANPGNPRS